MTLRITGGALRGRRIQTSKSNQTRPTTEIMRQAVFNKMQHSLPGCVFLDLYAGSGCMGIEALSRGAEAATFVEKSHSACSLIKKNLTSLELFQSSWVLQMDAFKAVEKLIQKKMQYSLIYIDPPYGTKELASSSKKDVIRILEAIEESNLLFEGGTILLEFTNEFEQKKATFEKLKWLSSKKYGRSTLYTIKG